MADDKHYTPGDFYRIDDRTGFKIRAKVSRKEWTSLIVHKDRWEPRQPQDFVKGVIDDQSVPEPRPRSPDVFLFPPAVTFVNGTYGAGSNLIGVQSIAGMQDGDTLEIMLDTEQYFYTQVMGEGVIGGIQLILLATNLPYSTGNLTFCGNIITDIGGGSGPLPGLGSFNPGIFVPIILSGI